MIALSIVKESGSPPKLQWVRRVAAIRSARLRELANFPDAAAEVKSAPQRMPNAAQLEPKHSLGFCQREAPSQGWQVVPQYLPKAAIQTPPPIGKLHIIGTTKEPA